MKRNIERKEALEFLFKFMTRVGGRHTRLHDDTIHKFHFYRKIIEEDPCSKCKHLRIISNGKPGRAEAIGVKCDMGVDQINLYEQAPFLEDPTCNQLSKKEDGNN